MSQGQKKRLRRMHAEDPCCRFCGVLTWVPEPGDNRAHMKPDRDTMATIEHLDTKYSPFRGTYNGRRALPRTTLACWRCNNRRNALEMKGRSIEELHERAQRHGRWTILSGEEV